MAQKSWKKILATMALAVVASGGLQKALPHNQWSDLGLIAISTALAAWIDPQKKTPQKKV